jgi:hypothetical protein
MAQQLAYDNGHHYTFHQYIPHRRYNHNKTYHGAQGNIWHPLFFVPAIRSWLTCHIPGFIIFGHSFSPKIYTTPNKTKTTKPPINKMATNVNTAKKHNAGNQTTHNGSVGIILP